MRPRSNQFQFTIRQERYDLLSKDYGAKKSFGSSWRVSTLKTYTDQLNSVSRLSIDSTARGPAYRDELRDSVTNTELADFRRESFANSRLRNANGC